MKRLLLPLACALAALMAWPLAARAQALDNAAILEELRAMKAKIAELEPLKAKVAELEAALAKSTRQNEMTRVQYEQHDEAINKIAKAAKAPDIRIGGALRFNYAYQDWNENRQAKGGDLGFDIFRLDVDGSIDNIVISAQYRWYTYMDVIHHGWIGYNFSEDLQGQFGLTQVPFGILPYASHNWWETTAYNVGLEDDYDLGVKFIYQPGPWDIQLAFFKNADWGDPSKLERYSYDVVKALGQANEETNQVNARVAYTFTHSEKMKTEVGLSGEYGQLYNSDTDSFGSHWAAAAHLNGFYGPFNLMLEYARYKYDPHNPAGVSDKTVVMGAYADAYEVASEADIYIAGVSYDVPVSWGPVTNLQFYNDFSLVRKAEASFNDSMINTLGCLVTAGPVYTYFDIISGKNAMYLGGPRDSYAAGDSNAGWHTRFNINVGYYF